MASEQATAQPTNFEPAGHDKKYCADCGKQILRRAEICPECGCRQAAAPRTTSTFFSGVIGANSPELNHPELQGDFVGQMAKLLILNFLWNGLGNLAIGDKRGWAMGFLNWLAVALSFVSFGIPVLIFFACCGWGGYQFLLAQTAQPAGE